MSRADRLSLAGLGLAIAISSVLLLWAGRDFFFFHDELTWFSEAPPDYDLGALLRPTNTHLIAIVRVVHATSLHVFGPDYLPWRVIGLIALIVCAGLFFALARRRIGPVAVLPTIVLLFFGSSWETVFSPVGLPFLFAVGAGLGSLLALERRDRRGDAAACLLIAVAAASHTFGVIFLVGAAVAFLVDEDRVRRAWIFAVPLALYTLWWSLVPRPSGVDATVPQASTLLLSPLYALGAPVAAITGLNLDPDPTAAGFDRLPEQSSAHTPILGLAGGVLLLVRLRRGHLHPTMWTFVATLLAFLASIALAAGLGRPPTAARYLFPGAVIVLLAAVEAARGVRFSGRAVGALLALTALSLAVNLYHLREAERYLSAYGIHAGPTLAMVELSAVNVEPGFRPGGRARGASPREVTVSAREYLRGTARWGSIAPTLEEVRRRPGVVRDRADVVLARAQGLQLAPGAPEPSRDACEPIREARAGRPTRADLPPGGRVVLENAGRRRAVVRLRRFGRSFAASVGLPAVTARARQRLGVSRRALSPGETAVLEPPGDAAPEPWQMAVSGDAVRVCQAADERVHDER